MIDEKLLSVVANRLLASLHEHEDHPDVRELLSNERFMSTVREAINGRIQVARDLGMGRWSMESNLSDLKDVSDLFFQFTLALQGRTW